VRVEQRVIMNDIRPTKVFSEEIRPIWRHYPTNTNQRPATQNKDIYLQCNPKGELL
jgi:hypothetical protein